MCALHRITPTQTISLTTFIDVDFLPVVMCCDDDIVIVFNCPAALINFNEFSLNIKRCCVVISVGYYRILLKLVLSRIQSLLFSQIHFQLPAF